MYLSGQEILNRLTELFPNSKEEFDSDSLQEASYDLRMGSQVFISHEQLPVYLSEENPVAIIPSGAFALLISYEEIGVPEDLIGFITTRLKFKLQGLINVSGFHVDPSYKGHLIFSVQNVGPNDIRIYYRECVFTMFWSEVKGKIPDFVRQRVQRKPFNRISGELMNQLGGGSVTLGSLKRDLDRLDHIIKVYAPIMGALFLSVLGWIIKEVFFP